MRELSVPAKCVLMASATLMIGFSTLASCRDNEPALPQREDKRASSSLAISALPFVTWPKASFMGDDSPFVIGILGSMSKSNEDTLAPYVDGKKKVQGRAVRLQRYKNANDIGECHALVVTGSCERAQVQQAIQRVSGKSMLTIGEGEGFAESGGVLSIVKNGDDSILNLNLRAADRQQLKIDARLVNVSVLVKET